MKKPITIILPVIISALALTSCNSHSPLLTDLGTQLSDISELILTDSDGNDITVTDSADIARIGEYKKSEKLPEDREPEVFDNTNFTLCTVITNTHQEIAFYIWNTGEIICTLGEELDSEYYIYTTEGEPVDSEYVEDMFYKYK